ncbi:MAG: VCBS repeat-containing protein [Ignavibacteria bacterium]|nr:VCBS repeat-containing protein [Ignavibacteria bacterium]
MKNLIIFFISIAVLSTIAVGQTAKAIPELQEWWRAPADEQGLGQYGVSHIPNFYHGKDAMAVSIKNGTMETWLNRFPGDRESIFTWQTSGTILYGDLNGDGIRDYVCGTRIYRGIQNGEPPESGTIRAISMQPNMIADVNHDGYDDIIDCYEGGGRSGAGLVAQLVYGGPDFKDMKVVSIPCATSMDSTMDGEKMYIGTDGDLRFLMYSYKRPKDPRRDFAGYILFRGTWKTGDTVPTFEKLSDTIRYRDTDIPFQRGGAVYQSKYHSNIYFIAREALGTSNYNVIFYNISNDIFEQKIKYRMDNAPQINMLNLSINEDKYEDWFNRTTGNNFNIFRGGEVLDSVPIIQHHADCQGNINNIVAIGDVNGDSINDIAVFLESSIAPNCFRIMLGRKTTTGVSEPREQGSIFTLTEPTPHPLSRGKIATLSAIIIKQGIYILELYDLGGKHVADLKRI